MPLNPQTSTRDEFTKAALEPTCPENATASYRKMFDSLQKLFRLLAYDETMRPNINQTYMTPAASKNKVYFMWDFVGRTLSMLGAVDPARQGKPRQDKAWAETVSRCGTARMLITDTTGKLEAMNRSAGYTDDAGVPFSGEIVAAANELDGF